MVPRILCAIPGNDPFFAALVSGTIVVVLLPIASWGLPFRSALRWVSLPLLALLPLAAHAAWPYRSAESIAVMRQCSLSAGLATAEGPNWHSVWAVFQLAVLTWLAVQVLRYWRPPAHDAPDPR